jgi:hypothetical protein
VSHVPMSYQSRPNYDNANFPTHMAAKSKHGCWCSVKCIWDSNPYNHTNKAGCLLNGKSDHGYSSSGMRRNAGCSNSELGTVDDEPFLTDRWRDVPCFVSMIS